MISIVEIAGGNFRTDEESDHLNTKFMGYLGVKVRYLPARLAIARSLSLPLAPSRISLGPDAGKTIKGDTLFGTGGMLATWTALIVERLDVETPDLKNFQESVAAHWKRGLKLLEDDWQAANDEPSAFLRRLVASAGLSPHGNRGQESDGVVAETPVVQGRFLVPVGEVAEDASTGEQILWEMNGPGGSPHAAVMGGVGSGKTRTAVSMLRALRAYGKVPALIFDFKGDLGEVPQGTFTYGLHQMFEGRTVRPPESVVPLDVLALPSRTEIGISYAADRFKESFVKLKGATTGVRQAGAVYDAANRALRTHQPCHLEHVRDALRAIYLERGWDEDGATATMDEICRFPLFEPTTSPAEFFSSSWVVSLPSNAPEKATGIVVNLILDCLDRYLNSLPEAETDGAGNRGLRIICAIDEAHRILGTRLPGLSSLIRQSRSKGGSVLLISQSPDDFSGEDDDFLNEMGLIVAFATNAKPAAAGRVLGKGANLATLTTGECLVKRRGDTAARRVIAWRRK